MPTVPTYLESQNRVALQPEFTQNNTTRATADDFGAAVGRGLTQVGAGLEQVSDAQAAVTRMTNEAHATDAANQWVQQKNELLYNPDNGYSNAEGRNAVDGYDGYKKNIEELTKRATAALSPGAAFLFKQKVDGYEGDALAQGLRIQSAGTKQYIIGQHAAAAATANDQAVQSPSDENRFQSFIGQGLAEVRASAAKQGFSPEQTDRAVIDYVSNARKSAALQLSLNDPLAAAEYATTHAGEMNGQDRADVLSRLKPELARAAGNDSVATAAARPAPNEFAAGGLSRDQYAMLSVISGKEAHGYNILNGGSRFSDFSKHPAMIGAGGTSTAAGRYQFIAGTWETAAKALGLTDFSPASQDRAAIWLAQRDYHTNTGRDLMTDVTAGNFAAIRRGLGSTWESFAKESDNAFSTRMRAALSGPVRAGVVTMGEGTVTSPYRPAPSASDVVAAANPSFSGSTVLAGGNGSITSNAGPVVGGDGSVSSIPAGNNDVPAAFRLSDRTEAVLAGLPAAYADDIRRSAEAGFAAEQSKQQTAQKAIQTAQVGAYELRIANGDDTVTPTMINHDTVMTDGQKANMINRLNERNKSAIQTTADVAALVRGNLSVDPYSEQDRKRVDNAWRVAAASATPEQLIPALHSVVQQTGTVPISVFNAMRGDLSSGNVSRVALALTRAHGIALADPGALGRSPNGDALMADAALYQHYTQDLGLVPDVAAARILDLKDPAKRLANDAMLGKETDKASNAYKIKTQATEANARAMFATGTYWKKTPTLGYGFEQAATLPEGGKTRDGAPSLGGGVLASAAIVADYKERLTDALTVTNGDLDAAKNLAESRMKMDYGTSSFSLAGPNAVVWLPPEKTYRADADGSHAYIEEQVKAALKEQGISATDVYLHPDKETLAEASMPNTRPSYILFYKDANGIYERFQHRFHADPPSEEQIAAVKAASKKKEIDAASAEQKENARLQERSQDREAVMADFLAGPPKLLEPQQGPKKPPRNANSGRRQSPPSIIGTPTANLGRVKE